MKILSVSQEVPTLPWKRCPSQTLQGTPTVLGRKAGPGSPGKTEVPAPAGLFACWAAPWAPSFQLPGGLANGRLG